MFEPFVSPRIILIPFQLQYNHFTEIKVFRSIAIRGRGSWLSLYSKVSVYRFVLVWCALPS